MEFAGFVLHTFYGAGVLLGLDSWNRSRSESDWAYTTLVSLQRR